MGKKFLTVLATIVAFCSLTTLAISQMDRKTRDDLYSQMELYSYTLTTVQADYVDDTPPKDLIYGSLKGMLSSLDPHSQFMTPDEYKELKTETQGKFGGLGIEISIRDGLLTIITPIEDTPAWKVGLKAGDRIVKIEDELTREMTLSDAVKLLRGKPGTSVNITVLREEEFEVLEFTVERQVIHIQDVKNVQILKDDIGYLRLTEFRADSARSFKKALNQLKKDGAQSLIIDLRNNPGGLLSVAIRITEFFLKEGEVIVSTRGRHESQNSISFSTNKNDVVEWPVTILINKGSASGSEILAGALKDNKRGIVLGETSFGKGSVQSVIPLPDGSGLRLTTSKYFTPSGVSIHGTGITPDIVVKYVASPEKKKDSKEEKVSKVFDGIEKNGEEKKALSQEEAAEEKRIKIREALLSDNQVIAAMSVLKGVRVYQSFSEK